MVPSLSCQDLQEHKNQNCEEHMPMLHRSDAHENLDEVLQTMEPKVLVFEAMLSAWVSCAVRGVPGVPQIIVGIQVGKELPIIFPHMNPNYVKHQEQNESLMFLFIYHSGY